MEMMKVSPIRAKPSFFSSNQRNEWAGALWLVVLTGWLISHAQPALWLTSTWATGGDVASQVFYASVFSHWFAECKISGWMPESFAGFPAFTYYFPFPFILMALLANFVGLPVAFKLVNMLPVFLLPAATYLFGRFVRWPVAVRLLAAAATAGALLQEETSIWGGNILSVLAGEFAYSWGMLAAVVFWGVLAWSLRRGKLWWMLAALLEVAVALSHGYALLMAGFGSFFLLLFSATPGRDLRGILQVHALAFCLLGFWLIPLFENLPWSIPNDATAWVNSWRELLPATLWPFALLAPALPVALALCPIQRGPLIFLLGIAVLALFGFMIGHRIGLAEARFFPYAQWALAVAAAVAAATLLQRWTVRPLWWTSAALLALAAWWEPHIEKVEAWSAWNLEGYENKPLWPAYQKLAQAISGPLSGPRAIFEHDPGNIDVGSTRALEALPMFGAGPVLEGLYMESALTGPFIYQLQAEISERPSSPLARYPAISGSVDNAVLHMRELYTDTLILRSPAMKARFGSDPRFDVIAEPEPFLVLQLRGMDSALVEVASEPLHRTHRRKWLDRAYRRFHTAPSYPDRLVFARDDEVMRLPTGEAPSTQVRIVEMTREKLIFSTEAVGHPHLIRMTYHPRWRSANGERIHLVEPSFMLVVPQTERVELVYGFSWGDVLGWIFTFGGLGAVGMILLMPSLASLPTRESPPPQAARPAGRRLTIIAGGVILVSAWSWYGDPERYYRRGHDLLEAQHWQEAARAFDTAVEGRHVALRKAEALFWAARSFEYAGEAQNAGNRYVRLGELYPESYWYPETLFRLVDIYVADRRAPDAQLWLSILEERFPDNHWTREARRRLAETESAP